MFRRTKVALLALTLLLSSLPLAPLPILPAARAQEVAQSPISVGRIAGVVQNRDGKPVAGRTVYLILNANDTKGTKAEIRGTAVSDAQGKISFEKAGEVPQWGRLLLLTRKPGADIGLEAVDLTDAEQNQIILMPTKPVQGAIQNSQGQPLVGVTVETQYLTRYRGTGFGSSVGIYLPKELSWSVQTDAKGEYRSPDVPDSGAVSLALRKEGYNEGNQYANRQASSPASNKAVTLYRKTALRGTLKCSDTAMPFEKMTLVAMRNGEYAGGCPVEKDGTFRFESIRPGALTLTLSAQPTSEWQPTLSHAITLNEGEITEGVTVPVTAQRGFKVVGRLLDAETGKGIPKSGVNTTTGGVLTDAEGNYTFFAPLGKTTIHLYSGAINPEYLLPRRELQQEVSGEAGQTVTVPDIRLQKGKNLAIRVVDPTGKPVNNATVYNNGGDPWFDRNTRTDRKGEIKVLGLAPEKPLKLSVRSDAGNSLPVDVDLKTTESLTLTVRPDLATNLSGMVQDDNGKPVTGATVQVLAMYGNWGDYPATVTTDAEGYWQAANLPPTATFSVKIEAARHRGGQSSTWKAESGGSHDFGTIALTRLTGYVVGIVVDANGKPVPGAKVFNSGDSDQRNQTTTNAQGRFRLEGMTAGVVYISVEKKGLPLVSRAVKAPNETLRIALKPNVVPVTPPGLIAAQERFAAFVMDKLIADTENKPEREWERQRIVDLLVPRDPRRATALAEASGQSCMNSLSNSMGRQALKRSLPEMIEWVQKVDNIYWRSRHFLDISREATLEQARAIMPFALTTVRAIEDPTQQLAQLAATGDRMRELGMPESKEILQECAQHAAKMGVKDSDGYYRGYVAERVAEVDLDAGLSLISALESTYDRYRYTANVAVRYILRSPELALKLVNQGVQDTRTQQNALARMCYYLAPTNPERAEAILTSMKGNYERSARVNAMLWMAERFPSRERSMTMLQRVEDYLTEWADAYDPNEDTESPAISFAYAALVGKRMGYNGTANLLARAIATRPTLAGRYGGSGERYRTQATLAVLLAMTDPTLGKEYLAVVLPRMGNLKLTQETWVERDLKDRLLLAAALCDPPQAEIFLRSIMAQQEKSDAQKNPPQNDNPITGLEAAEIVLDKDKRQEMFWRMLMIDAPDAKN